MSILLCDVGGTHIRFSLNDKGKISPQKLRVDAHQSLPEAISVFLRNAPVQPESIKAFYLAFSNRNEWNTHPDDIRQVLPKAVIRQVNDFEANAHGVLVADSVDFTLLNRPQGAAVEQASKAVIGVGTGLGLAYICGGKGKRFIQRTHGGHMLPAFVQEHEELYRYLSRDKTNVLIYEDALSGKGLFEIYKFLSARAHLDAEYLNAESLMANGKENPVFQQALYIFHHILGVFSHQAVAFGYSYGGVYLTGGVIDRLMLAGLFSASQFMEGFAQKNVSIVYKDVMATPLYWIRDEFVSLKGLLYLAQEDGHNA